MNVEGDGHATTEGLLYHACVGTRVCICMRGRSFVCIQSEVFYQEGDRVVVESIENSK